MVAFAKLINYLERFFLTIKRILTVVVLVGCLITLSFFTPLFSTIVLFTPLSTLYNSLILKGLKFNNFLAKNCKPSIYRALEKRVESQV